MNRYQVGALWFFVGLVIATLNSGGVHADPQPALDRELVERMTRALEEQVRATERLTQATERCKR